MIWQADQIPWRIRVVIDLVGSAILAILGGLGSVGYGRPGHAEPWLWSGIGLACFVGGQIVCVRTIREL